MHKPRLQKRNTNLSLLTLCFLVETHTLTVKYFLYLFVSRKEKSKIFPARLKLATFHVLGGRDNHYTTETTVYIKGRVQGIIGILSLGRKRKFIPLLWYKGGGGGVNGTPPRSFWYVAVIWNDFTFSGKPFSFLTKWGIFQGWWCCWRPVTSPIMTAILVFTKN